MVWCFGVLNCFVSHSLMDASIIASERLMQVDLCRTVSTKKTNEMKGKGGPFSKFLCACLIDEGGFHSKI